MSLHQKQSFTKSSRLGIQQEITGNQKSRLILKMAWGRWIEPWIMSAHLLAWCWHLQGVRGVHNIPANCSSPDLRVRRVWISSRLFLEPVIFYLWTCLSSFMMEEVELFLGNILEICGEPFLIVTVMGHSCAQSVWDTYTNFSLQGGKKLFVITRVSSRNYVLHVNPNHCFMIFR